MNRNVTRTGGLLLLIIVALVTTLPAAAQDGAPARTITVSGYGQESGTPDVAYLYLGVDSTNENPTEAFNQVNTMIEAVNAAVMALGIAGDDIQTSSINLWVQDSFDPATGSPTGGRTYRAQNMVTVTVRDVNAVGDVITAAIAAGANSINGLSFGIAEPTALAQAARLNAIADARARAEQIAAALGVTLGEPISADESISGGAVSQPMYAMGMGGGGAVSEGQLAVSVQLTITYAIQ